MNYPIKYLIILLHTPDHFHFYSTRKYDASTPAAICWIRIVQVISLFFKLLPISLFLLNPISKSLHQPPLKLLPHLQYQKRIYEPYNKDNKNI